MYFESFLWQVYSRVSRAVVSYDILNRKLFGRLVVRAPQGHSATSRRIHQIHQIQPEIKGLAFDINTKRLL